MEPPDFAKRMIDLNRLMEGENRQSRHPEDADHWFSVYQELVGFKEKLLAQTKDFIRQVPETRPELAGYDVPFLEAELGRLRSGLTYWAARRGNPGNEPA